MEKIETKVLIGKVRASYVHVFVPTSIDGDTSKAKYSVSLIVPKSDEELVRRIKGAISRAFDFGMSSKWGNKKPLKPRNPLRDGDEERPDDEAYAGSYYINASCKTKPGVNKVKGYEVGSDGKRKLVTIPCESEEEMYSGCFVYASVNFYPFDTAGNKGVACGLNNILKVDDGEPLGGRISADADFAEVQLSDDELPFSANADPFAGGDCPY